MISIMLAFDTLNTKSLIEGRIYNLQVKMKKGMKEIIQKLL